MELMTQRDIELKAKSCIELAEEYVDRNYLIDLPGNEAMPVNAAAQSFMYLSLCEVTRVVYDPEEGLNEKLVSVYSALYNMGSSLIYILDSDENGVHIYMGTRDIHNPETAENLLQMGLKGQFPGMELRPASKEGSHLLKSRFPKSYARKNLASVSAVPSYRSEDPAAFVQGMEKLIETMAGKTFTALFIAEPLDKTSLLERRNGFEDLATALSNYANMSVSFAQNESTAVASGITESFSNTVSESLAKTTSSSNSFSTGVSRSKSSGSSYSFGLLGIGANKGSQRGTSENSTTGSSVSDSRTQSRANSETKGTSHQETGTTGSALTLSMTNSNRHIQSLLERINLQLERIKDCESFGLWEGAAYFVADEREIALIAANTYKALISGSNTNVEDSFINIWGDTREERDNILSVMEYIRYGMHPVFQMPTVRGQISQMVTPACAISGTELPVFAGLPMRSVDGITVISAAEFGRNIVELGQTEGKRRVVLGSVCRHGVPHSGPPLSLKVNTLASHTLVVGASGCGKSNTIYVLLEKLATQISMDAGVSNVKFLVIEPAKGEYKHFFRHMPDTNIFTVTPDEFDTLHINPFAFPEGISLLEHLDALVEICSACWPLYAAMPAILKNSFERAYQVAGWDLRHSIYLGEGEPIFPTFHDVLKQLPKEINRSEYSATSKSDYIGALVTRVASLTRGTMGSLFCDRFSIPDKVLFDQNTIIDISRLASIEAQSLLMGILVLKLNQYRMVTSAGANLPLKHVTVLEEAHNLLKRVNTQQSQETGNLQGKAVEMLCNSIAEMRTFGEGFIIADQMPSALATTAVANTSTKIVMRIADYDDAEAIGKSIGLEKTHIDELGKLPQGAAVVYQSNWLQAVQAHINHAHRITGKKELPPPPSYRQMQVFRARLAAELYRQKYETVFDEKRLLTIIRAGNLTDMENLRYKMAIQSFMNGSGKQRLMDYSDLMVWILDCEDLVEMCNLEIDMMGVPDSKRPAYAKREAKKWGQLLQTRLKRFTGLADEQLLTEIYQCLLIYAKEHIKRTDMQTVTGYLIKTLFT